MRYSEYIRGVFFSPFISGFEWGGVESASQINNDG